MTLWLWQEWQIANLCSNGAAGTRLRSEKWISCKQQYLRRPTYFSWHNPNLLSVAPNLYMRSPKWVSGRGSSGCPWRKSRLIALYGQQMEITVAAGVKGVQRICWGTISLLLFTSVARVIKKINMSYTTILYNGRKELRSYSRLGNVTEILIFKCRQKTRLSQRVMHGTHFISVTKALIFPIKSFLDKNYMSGHIFFFCK